MIDNLKSKHTMQDTKRTATTQNTTEEQQTLLCNTTDLIKPCFICTLYD